MAVVRVAPVGPLATTAVTTTPPSLTSLSCASRNRTTGCVASGTPLCAAAAGSVTSTSFVAPPVVTATVAVWEIATPLIVADTVLDPVTVELSVPVAAPLALVGAAGCVNVFPVPVAASTTVAPGIGLLNSSSAVPVMVETPDPAVIGDVAVTVERTGDTGAGMTVTAAVCVMSTVFTRADTVFASALVELSVPVATPFASDGPTGGVTVFPVPVTDSVTVFPLTTLP